MDKHISATDISALDRLERIALVNSLAGYRPACLVGTVDDKGNQNLAIFSSLVHLGSSPALFGLITRPDTVDRHTLANIEATKQYTINHVHTGMSEAAHYTSAKFEAEVSEFEAVGLTPQILDEWSAPYVLESRVKLGMELVDVMPIETNGTLMIIGKVAHVHLPEEALAEDGHLDHNICHTVAVTGLDRYHRGMELARYPYARASEVPAHLTDKLERPDQVVFDEESQRYGAGLMHYGTDQGAPSIVPTDLTLWKNTGASKISHHLKARYDEIRGQFEAMKDLYSWNEMVYQAKFSFEPVLGQTYHLYRDNQEQLFLSMIPPESWKREHLGSFRLNADQIWEKID
jgi:flavin reductase (DIM6/NTAB) family NADH-FMN oxidoreductase RutF